MQVFSGIVLVPNQASVAIYMIPAASNFFIYYSANIIHYVYLKFPQQRVKVKCTRPLRNQFAKLLMHQAGALSLFYVYKYSNNPAKSDYKSGDGVWCYGCVLNPAPDTCAFSHRHRNRESGSNSGSFRYVSHRTRARSLSIPGRYKYYQIFVFQVKCVVLKQKQFRFSYFVFLFRDSNGSYETEHFAR